MRYDPTKMHDDDLSGIDLFLYDLFLQVKDCESDRLIAKGECPPLGGNEVTRAEVREGVQGFFRINMGIMHEPTWMVGGYRQKGVIDAGKSAANLPVSDEISAVAPVIDAHLRCSD